MSFKKSLLYTGFLYLKFKTNIYKNLNHLKNATICCIYSIFSFTPQV
ncbi:hypothetical protein ABLAC_10660 [Acinetobacter baumannii LAC-4]|nr:hypothetical protein BJAB0715_02798 [Acinetobacter baumannii BJAB0715]AIY36421.1 hypothetical protein ABLAC_10660 [Acinetobacter baumannii LAC-4]EXE23897.1 hypothetical protein J561_0003 [Acinetobacter baumannii 50595]EXH97056.1 hypothetical protein J609_0707 [Acinetobacter baumannii 3390]EXQ83922.1 hypothetical protein J683_0391 [Acinetobacter baumannii 1007214]KCY37508.1 hypothetical protein J726_0056 [Acinetobacter baumannii 1262761-105]